jgi:hypothetical protein
MIILAEEQKTKSKSTEVRGEVKDDDIQFIGKIQKVKYRTLRSNEDEEKAVEEACKKFKKKY